jgi:hypothetical protein
VGDTLSALTVLSARDLRETAKALRRLADESLPELSRVDARIRDRLTFAASVLDRLSRSRASGTSRAVVDAAAWAADRSSH